MWNVRQSHILQICKEIRMENRNVGKELRMLNNAVRRYLNRNSHRANHENLTCSNTWIIAHLAESEAAGRDVFQRDLEEEFGVTRSTASKVLILLEKKGLISREVVSHDARLKKIVLTDRSRKIAAEMNSDGENLEKQLIKGFSDEEIAALLGYFDRLMKNLEQAEACSTPAKED